MRNIRVACGIYRQARELFEEPRRIVMILVTGASGNVGKEVLKQMAHIGVQVRATFQSPSSVASAPSGVEIAIMDYNKPETIRAALQGVERVFLVGPPTQKLAALERQAMDQIKRSEERRVGKEGRTRQRQW